MKLSVPVSCVLATIALAFGAVAHADTTDDQYLAELSRLGITGEPGQLIAEGRAACNNYGSPALVGQIAGLMGRGMSNVQASNLILVGMRAYCPEKVPAGLPPG